MSILIPTSSLEALLGQLPTAIGVLDGGRRLRYANPRLAVMLQRSLDRLIGRVWERAVHPVDRALDIVLFEELRAGVRTEYQIEQQLRRGNGAVFWARVSFSALDIPDTINGGFVVSVEDISELHQLRFDVREQTTQLAIAIDAVRMGVIDWDLESGVANLSVSACALFGLAGDRRSFSLDEIHARVHPDDADAVWQHLQNVQPSSQSRAFEFRVRAGDESTRWLSTRGRQYFGADGLAVRRLCVVVDISERKLLEEQYRQAQKMEALGRLAGGIAHDFNNLLTIIGATGEFVRQDLPAHHPAADDLNEIVAAVDRGRALTRQLMTFSRHEAVRRHRVDIGEVLRQVEPMLRRVAASNVALTISGERRPLIVLVDQNQLEQVILNLVINARDALTDGGQIDVHTRLCTLDDASVELRPGLTPGRYALLSVSDNGVGMSTAVQSRIFEPFFTTKDALHGTGLGLSSVFGIVKASDGYVGVYSEPGEGATFRVYLPLLDSSECDECDRDSIPAAAARSLPRGSETILLVDDEPQLRLIAKRILSELGYTVLDAADGAAALRMSRLHPGTIDLLLSDISLPGYDGREICEAMTLTRPGVPTVFMSGYAADAVGHRLYLEPGAPFLEKPFSRQSLAMVVRSALDAAAVVRERSVASVESR